MPVVKICNEDTETAYRYPSDIRNLINYIYKDSKVVSSDPRYPVIYVRAMPDFFCSDYIKIRETIPEIIIRNHEVFGKTEGKLIHHIVITFTPEEFFILDRCGCLPEFMNLLIHDYFNMGYIAGYAIHWDTQNHHVHLFVDNISYFDGHRFYLPNECIIIAEKLDYYCNFYRSLHRGDCLLAAVCFPHILPPAYFAQNIFPDDDEE